MFIEQNELKGLIILLENLDNLDQWSMLSKKISCSFIVNSEEELVRLGLIINTKESFILLKDTLIKTVKQAMRLMGIQPYETVVVSEKFNSLKMLQHLHVGTALVSQTLHQSQVGEMPDYFIRSVSDFVKHFLDFPGYFAEVNTTAIRTSGTSIIHFSNKGIIFEFDLNYKQYNFKVISCGRYYSPKHAYKNRVHQLSHRIRKSKQNTTQDLIFADVYTSVVKGHSVDGITRVPPRPSEVRDRIKPIVEKVSRRAQVKDYCKELKCIEDYPKQKDLGQQARAINVEGKFSASTKISGKRIILIDDVLTTGATVGECAKTLMEAGAREVIILVLAVNQFEPVWPHDAEELECPNKCGGILQLRMFTNGVGFIYGCSNFFEQQCEGKFYYSDGWKQINLLNKMTDDVIEEDTLAF